MSSGTHLSISDDGVAEVQRRAPEAQHRRVVQRRADDVDVVVLRLNAEEEEQPDSPSAACSGVTPRSLR